MYSLTRSSMTTQLCTMTSGMRNVVKMTNSIEMPSTPSLNCMTSSQPRCSTNWKPALVGSNFTQRISEIRKVMTVVHSATQRALPLAAGLRKPMITAPTSGMNITIDKSGAEDRSI